MALTLYAPTERYVTDGGAGANDGTSFGAAWDYSQILANAANGMRFNCSGDHVAVGNVGYTVTAGTSTPIQMLGWKSDQSAPSISFADHPSITGGFDIDIGSNSIFRGFNLSGGGGLNVGGSGLSDSVLIDFCDIGGAAGRNGIAGDNNIIVKRSKVHDCGLAGIDFDGNCVVMLSEIYDNSDDGLNGDSGMANLRIIGSFIARNGGHGINCGNNVTVHFCTIDDNVGSGIGISLNSAGPHTVVGTQITSNGVGIGTPQTNAGFIKSLEYCNLFGNTSDGIATVENNNQAADSGYLDVGNNNYEVTEASMIDLPIPLLGSMTIGAWQPSSGGAGGGMIVHPGMSGGLRG